MRKARKSTKVNRTSKFKNKLDRKAWRAMYKHGAFTSALKAYTWLKNRAAMGLATKGGDGEE